MLLSISALCSFGLLPALQADPPAPVATLMGQIKKACLSHDLAALKALEYAEGTPQDTLDEVIHYTWEIYLSQDSSEPHYTLEKIEYASLEQELSDKNINQKALLASCGPETMNGTIYRPNLKIIGFITLTYKNSSGTGTYSNIESVGYAPDGTAKLVNLRPDK